MISLPSRRETAWAVSAPVPVRVAHSWSPRSSRTMSMTLASRWSDRGSPVSCALIGMYWDDGAGDGHVVQPGVVLAQHELDVLALPTAGQLQRGHAVGTDSL